MIKLLQRTETLKSASRILFQQADIGRDSFHVGSWPWTPTTNDNCYYCRYHQTFQAETDFMTCMRKHCCDYARFPFIEMGIPINSQVYGEWDNPDGSYLTYQRTGIYKQVQFEAMSHHIQLYLCNNGQARCNASCWWHAWRLANKRTVTQCGGSHLCQNDGSMWVQMVPTNATLRQELIQQL